MFRSQAGQVMQLLRLATGHLLGQTGWPQPAMECHAIVASHMLPAARHAEMLQAAAYSLGRQAAENMPHRPCMHMNTSHRARQTREGQPHATHA